LTKTRTADLKIVIEGSADGQEWREICFCGTNRGRFSDPHFGTSRTNQGLDWQMWFAASGSVRENPWMVMLMWRLLEGSPHVLALLESNPFADGPPKYVRPSSTTIASRIDGRTF